LPKRECPCYDENREKYTPTPHPHDLPYVRKEPEVPQRVSEKKAEEVFSRKSSVVRLALEILQAAIELSTGLTTED
jgi:hypothetical protein